MGDNGGWMVVKTPAAGFLGEENPVLYIFQIGQDPV
jgi:hypothetical protein